MSVAVRTEFLAGHCRPCATHAAARHRSKVPIGHQDVFVLLQDMFQLLQPGVQLLRPPKKDNNIPLMGGMVPYNAVLFEQEKGLKPSQVQYACVCTAC